MPTVLGIPDGCPGIEHPVLRATGDQAEASGRPSPLMGTCGRGPLGQHPCPGRATPSSGVQASWELGLRDASDPVTPRPLDTGRVGFGMCGPELQGLQFQGPGIGALDPGRKRA